MSLIPEKINFKIWRGATFRKVLTLHEGDAEGDLFDFTGYLGAKLVLKSPEGDDLGTLTTEDGGIILGGITGVVIIYISDEDTEVLDWQVAMYELAVNNPDGDRDVLLYGGMSVRGFLLD